MAETTTSVTSYMEWWIKDFIDRQRQISGKQWGNSDANGLPEHRGLRSLITIHIEHEQKYRQERERIFNAGYELGKQESMQTEH